MNTAIDIRQPQPEAIQEWKSPSQIKQRIQAIRHLLETTLKPDVDYGVIPGTQKPTLYKSGSEQILAMFQIAVDPVVEDLSTDDCARYRVVARLTNAVTQQFLGAGIGTCSSNETKYKWRKTYSKKEFDSTFPERRRMKYGTTRDGKEWEEMQVRQEPADVDNTILKMAKKRAQIDATLTVTGASSMFEQDLEDMSDETREEISRQQGRTRGKKQTAQQKEVGDVVCADCGAKNGHTKECKYAQQCPECHAPAGKPHASGCSKQQTQATEEVKPGDAVDELKWLVEVNKVTGKQSTQTDPQTKKQTTRDYLLLDCLNAAGKSVLLYCWHTGQTRDRLLAVKAKTHCVFTVKPQVSGDKTYYNIDQIVEITGEQAPSQGELIPPDNA